MILLQPKDGPPVAQGLKKDVRTSFQQPQPAQQAQPGTSEPAVEAAADRESAMKQSFQQKKVEMKKKKRDVMGLWD